MVITCTNGSTLNLTIRQKNTEKDGVKKSSPSIVSASALSLEVGVVAVTTAATIAGTTAATTAAMTAVMIAVTIAATIAGTTRVMIVARARVERATWQPGD